MFIHAITAMITVCMGNIAFIPGMLSDCVLNSVKKAFPIAGKACSNILLLFISVQFIANHIPELEAG